MLSLHLSVTASATVMLQLQRSLLLVCTMLYACMFEQPCNKLRQLLPVFYLSVFVCLLYV
jgi:hypothetical protein